LYIGGKDSDLLCRIYDKAKEAGTTGKEWFLKLWKLDQLLDIWRIEFQLRRSVLKQFGIDTLEDLIQRSGGVWAELTSSWLSFRLHDNPNTARRSIHPWVASSAGHRCRLRI
jgi:hypothetical protein